MQGTDEARGSLCSYVDLEARIPARRQVGAAFSNQRARNPARRLRLVPKKSMRVAEANGWLRLLAA
jgi:hypothetical protein